MEELSAKELFLLKVAKLADLISICDEGMAKSLAMGHTKDSLQIRQQLHSKHKYCEELTQVFHDYNADIYVYEYNSLLPKAA
jgi:hypothetical protein